MTDHPRLVCSCYRWAALIVVAGFGYYTVKSNNTAKKREFMIKQGQQLQQQRDAVNGEGQSATISTPICECTIDRSST